MTSHVYQLLEEYMLSCMGDSAHDKEHVYRVLYSALEIAGEEPDVDYDVLICACLLHDIGRGEQFENPSLCHAQVGSEKAYRFLREQGLPKTLPPGSGTAFWPTATAITMSRRPWRPESCLTRTSWM